MQEYNAGSVSERSEMTPKATLSTEQMALKGMEIAKQEVLKICALGRPNSVDQSDLLSIADETIADFLRHYTAAGEEELALLRIIIRNALKDAVRKARRQEFGIEIPPGCGRDAAYDQVDLGELTARGVISAPQSEALLLFTEGLQQEQIAKTLGINQSSVARRIDTARKNIRTFFK